jgi:hypothetical protein
MDNDPLPQPEASQRADSGEPGSGFSVPRESLVTPPFAVQSWQPPSKFAKLLGDSITITLRIGPTMLVMWMVAPDEFKYQIRKQARWLPYLVKYAAWWLRQEGW